MMEGWKEYRLRDLVDTINRGITPKYVETDGFFVINQKCIRDNFLSFSEARLTSKSKKITPNKKVNIGDILVNSTGTGTLGRTAYVKELPAEVTTVDTHVTIVRPSDFVDNRYLGYNLGFQEPQIENYAKGATNQQELGRDDLGLLKINLPPLPIQRTIAKILSAYDDLIENNLKRIKLLEEMAQITYEEWFVRMKFPGHETAVFDEETGLLEGWKKVKLGKYIKFIKGKKVDELFDEQIEGTAKVLLLNALEDGKFKFTKIGKHTKTKRGDIMMLMDGARSSYVFYSENGIIGSTMAKIVSKQIPPTLLYHFFKTILGWLQTNNTGAAIPHANKSFINSIQFAVPKEDILNLWTKRIDIINNEVWNLKDQNQYLKEARDILLPRLMTGMIDVENITGQTDSVMEDALTMTAENRVESNK